MNPMIFRCFGQDDRRDLADFLRRGSWTNRYLGVIPLGRGGGKHRWELGETSRTLRKSWVIAPIGPRSVADQWHELIFKRLNFSGRSVARLDVQMQFAYNSFAMRDRSYLTMINGFTTLIQYE